MEGRQVGDGKKSMCSEAYYKHLIFKSQLKPRAAYIVVTKVMEGDRIIHRTEKRGSLRTVLGKINV